MGLEYAKSSNMRDFGAGWCLPCPLSARKRYGARRAMLTLQLL